MLRSHSLTALFVSLCLGWTSGASAADLVEFLGPGTTYGTVLQRAAAVAQDASQLGFSSKSVPDDRSGTFSIEVFDDNVQVAVLSDDGVNVQVTDMGDINDPLGSDPQSLPGLNHLGEGQDLPTLGQSLKLIPGTLSANHRYRFEWQYRNTIHTSASDLDGMKVFVFGGNAQLALAKTKVKLSSLNTEDKEWDADAFINPTHNTLHFAGSVVTVQLKIPEVDTVRDLDETILTTLPLDGKLKAKLKIVNAHFLVNGNEETEVDVLLTNYGNDILRSDPAYVKIPDPWIGDVMIKLPVVDSGDEAATIIFLKTQGYVVVPMTTLRDKTIDTSVTWKEVTHNKGLPTDKVLPTSVTGISEEWKWTRPDPNDPNQTITTEVEMNPLWSKKETRFMRVTYQYGLRSGNTAIYAGLPIQEVFTPWVTGLTDVNLIDDNIQKALEAGFKSQKRTNVVFDDYVNEFLGANPSGVSTFVIGTAQNGISKGKLDCTQDAYIISHPEILKEMTFFKIPYPTSLTLTATQKYFCGKTELGGDMPRTVTGSYTQVGSKLKKEQQVSP